MAALAATSSATLSQSVMLIKSRLDQARREADRAESYAENLRAQADAQGLIVMQARQRINSLEKESVTSASSPSNSSPSPSNSSPSPSTSTSPRPSSDTKASFSKEIISARGGNTYIETLATVFQHSKPVLKSNLSATQKNIVISSLFDAANNVTTANQVNSQAIKRYDNQVVSSPKEIMGRVINATA